MPFEKNQILVHNTWGECVAIRPWNERETVCLVTRTGQRHILMNMLLKPLYAGTPNEYYITFIDDETLAELEARLSGGKQNK
jgi:hypothetical protein